MTSDLPQTICRITVVTARLRVDLALPSGMAVVELLPRILALAVPAADRAASTAGWVLGRLGGPPLDGSRSFAAQHITDGELLQLSPADQRSPDPVFDEIADAVAYSSLESDRSWSAEATRRTALSVFGLALLSVAWVLWRATDATATLPIAVAAMFATLLTGGWAMRWKADPHLGAVCGAGALPLALVAGLRSTSPDPVAGQWFSAATAVGVTALICLVVIGSHALFVAALVPCVMIAAAAASSMLLPIPELSAIAATQVTAGVGIVVAPRMVGRWVVAPRMLFNASTTAEPIPALRFDELARRSRVAHQVLLGSYCGLAITAGAAAVALIRTGVMACFALAVAGLLATALRARALDSARQVLALLTPTIGAGIAALVTMASRLDLYAVVVLLIAIATAALVVAGRDRNHRSSAVASQLSNTIEALATCALFPLAVVVTEAHRLLPGS